MERVGSLGEERQEEFMMIKRYLGLDCTTITLSFVQDRFDS